MSANNITLSFAPGSVKLLNTQYRVHDLALAEALGFTDIHKIRSLIRRHKKALEEFGEVSAMVAETSRKGGRPGREYWLTDHQAVYLCTKSETPRATAVTIAVVRSFIAVRQADKFPTTAPARKPLKSHGSGFDRLASLMERMSPEALDGFLKLLRDGGSPDPSYARLLSYLDTRLLDMGLPGYVHEEVRSIRRIAGELQGDSGRRRYG